MHSILKDIVEKKKLDVIEEKKNVGVTLVVTKGDHKGRPYENKFKQSIIFSEKLSVIGEIKLASPTEEFLGGREEIIPRAMAYEKAGVNAISFITEKHYFKSDISFIPKIKEKVSVPILQKDFVIDEYQIYQAKEIGSDALLLIARLVDEEVLKKFVLLCQTLGIEPVVEINTEEDLRKAIVTNTNIIAVNARDLETFQIDLDKACELLRKVPTEYLTLGFSGVKSNIEARKYKKAGAKGILVGTELMKAKNIKKFITNLKS